MASTLTHPPTHPPTRAPTRSHSRSRTESAHVFVAASIPPHATTDSDWPPTRISHDSAAVGSSEPSSAVIHTSESAPVTVPTKRREPPQEDGQILTAAGSNSSTKATKKSKAQPRAAASAKKLARRSKRNGARGGSCQVRSYYYVCLVLLSQVFPATLFVLFIVRRKLSFALLQISAAFYICLSLSLPVDSFRVLMYLILPLQ